MPEPVTAADCRLLLSLLKFAIVPPDQRERVEAWLEAKRDALNFGPRLEARQMMAGRAGLDETGHERN